VQFEMSYKRHSEGVTSDQLALLFDELKMAQQKAGCRRAR